MLPPAVQPTDDLRTRTYSPTTTTRTSLSTTTILSSYIRKRKKADPEKYKGKILEQYRTFFRDCLSVFRYQPEQFPDKETKVAWAESLLEDKPKFSWYNYLDDHERRF